MRTLAFAIAAASGLVLSCLSASAQSVYQYPYTTRIEPRPFYGATVTIEEGVRVFRPLPPHDRIIIDPGYAASGAVGTGRSRRPYIDGSRR